MQERKTIAEVEVACASEFRHEGMQTFGLNPKQNAHQASERN
jgi:hypothetical protein